MADPLLQSHYPVRGLYQALAVAAMCLQEQAATRPLIGDVVTALSYLASQSYDSTAAQSNRVGPSTARTRDRKVHSPHKNSPDFRQKDPFKGMYLRDEGGSSGRKSDLDELESRGSWHDSPAHLWTAREMTKNQRAMHRRRYGERSKEFGSFDGANEL